MVHELTDTGNKIFYSQDPDVYVEEIFLENAQTTPAPTSIPTPVPTPAPAFTPYTNTENYTYSSSQEDDDNDYYEDEEEYIFEYSDSEYLTKDDLKGMGYKKIWLAKNELYARHGRMFNNEELQDYFDSCSWYTREYTPEEWDELGDGFFFNDYEIENRNLLKKREEKLK